MHQRQWKQVGVVGASQACVCVEGGSVSRLGPESSWFPAQDGREVMCGELGAEVAQRSRGSRIAWEGMKAGAKVSLDCEDSSGEQGKGHTYGHSPGPLPELSRRAEW